MIQRQHLPHRSSRRRPRSAPLLRPVVPVGPESTSPLASAPPTDDSEPAILGFPAEFEPELPRPADDMPGDPLPDVPPAQPGQTAGSGVHLVVARRGEPFGGVALLLAGGAAVASLWLPWWRVAEVTGLRLVRQGLTILGSGPAALGHSGLWQPVLVVLGGGLHFLLGLLLFRRARTHRPVGLLALLVALAEAAGVVVPLANTDWDVRSFAPGMWCAMAVVLLGGLGALKAMLTAPKVSVDIG